MFKQKVGQGLWEARRGIDFSIMEVRRARMTGMMGFYFGCLDLFDLLRYEMHVRLFHMFGSIGQIIFSIDGLIN